MANVGKLLREEITKVSRREVRRHMGPARRLVAQHRHLIASLNRKIGQLERQVAQLSRRSAVAVKAQAGDEASGERIRFVAKGLQSHRNRLGLSAADFGKLIGVSANSVYAWESRKTTPRREQIRKIAALRKVGKRQAAKWLEKLAAK